MIPKHCDRGHPMTPENTFRYNNKWCCKECRRRTAKQRHDEEPGWSARGRQQAAERRNTG